MKTLIILLLVSVVALGQTQVKTADGWLHTSNIPIYKPNTMTLEAKYPYTTGTIITPAYQNGPLITIPVPIGLTSELNIIPIEVDNFPNEGDFRTPETPIKRPVKLAVEVDGYLKLINAFKVVTRQRYVQVPTPSCYGCATLSVVTMEWVDNQYHYEDKEGNILSEVYQLTKL
jgi:hypothetical protein